MPLAPRTLLALVLAGLGCAADPGAVLAQGSYDRHQAAGANGPVVLDADPGAPDDPTRARAVPVPSVMNGGAFGLTGSNYYNDSVTEGRFGARRLVNEYVLNPGRIAPPPGR